MPSHRHAAFEEGIYVLDGSIRATLDGETYEATAGSFLIIPWGLPHEVRNTEGSAARLRSWRCRRLLSRRLQVIPRRSTEKARLRTVGLRFGVFE
jgi:glyoxylate utilization-related uncharacterized protein